MHDLAALLDIYQAIVLIFRYSENVSYEELENNQEKQDAILRRIMIIGEATKRLSSEFKQEHSVIPWKQIAGMRDVITHDYDEVDLEEVWTVIKVNLPTLSDYIVPLLPENK
ncbi:DUF86 domain-containing protein [Crocosphaera sp. XPORK-15E]|uniref:HepT-like ribonuclease domain-containing protein n=1 Tax=Crocosphaera sp. XPORK-15E TaxID=3110247 RepID=UPI002B1EF822|nr:DUF86 domain-containing protein [Crocosphaera sp. XPORK-15E]MEA5533752.1 DUF86 domain-containing protein [Crocosphaera sp. XPORK-15E]